MKYKMLNDYVHIIEEVENGLFLLHGNLYVNIN